MSRGDIKEAIAMGEKSLELAPGDSYNLALHVDRLIESGRVDEGIQRIKQAIRLCPFPPAWFLSCLGRGFHLKGHNEAAIYAFKQVIDREPDLYIPRVWLTSALVELGKLSEAQTAAEAVLEVEPKFSVETWAQKLHSSAYMSLKDNLLVAGLPK